MRYWLRNYSAWPTYPQVYSNGKIIGGLDVCKDLAAKGELIPKVPKNSKVAPQERLKEILAEYKFLVLTNKFSYDDQKNTQAFLSKVDALYPNQ
jgi:hypothetical protein